MLNIWKILSTVVVLITMLCIAGCSTVNTSTKFSGEKLDSDTHVVVGVVKNSSGTEYPDIKPEKLMKDALTESLGRENLLQKADYGRQVVIDANIIEYNAGNAFLRSILNTSLWGEFIKHDSDARIMVQCDVKDEKGNLLGTIDTYRNVDDGSLLGLPTIGAWSYIFKDAAEDIVSELKLKGFK